MIGIPPADPSHHDGVVDTTQEAKNVRVDAVCVGPCLDGTKCDSKVMYIGDHRQQILGDSHAVHTSYTRLVQPLKVRVINDVFQVLLMRRSLRRKRRGQGRGTLLLMLNQLGRVGDPSK